MKSYIHFINEKASRKDAMNKLKKTIKSAKDLAQLVTAANMAQNYYKMYGETFLDDFINQYRLKNQYPTYDKLVKLLDNQSGMIKLLKKIKK